MTKLELTQAITDLMDQKAALAVDSVKSDFAPILTAISMLDEGSADTVELQKQITALQAQVEGLTSQVDTAKAEIAKDEALLSEEMTKEAKLQAKIEAIKAALEG